MSDHDDRERLDEAGAERPGDDVGDVRRPDDRVEAPPADTPRRDDRDETPAPCDEERVLAFALGLADDPELADAAKTDGALALRIEGMRAEVAAVAAGLDRVVPPPPEDYADLGAARWGELRNHVAAPAPPAARRRPAWLRVLAPAVAVALVLVAGVVGLQRLGQEAAERASTTGSGGKAAESYDGRDGTAQDATGAPEGAGGATPVLGRGTPAASDYSTIVVARAEEAADGRQTFTVARVVKGTAGSVVTLEIAGAAAPAGTLHVLYLKPTTGIAATPVPEAAPSGVGGPAPREGAGTLRAFRYAGLPALALELPRGADPATLTLP